MAEHIHGKDGVPGSNPGLGSDIYYKKMATKSKKKAYIRLQCSACQGNNYIVKKSKGQDEEKKLNLKKFCRQCRGHKPHKEIKR